MLARRPARKRPRRTQSDAPAATTAAAASESSAATATIAAAGRRRLIISRCSRARSSRPIRPKVGPKPHQRSHARGAPGVFDGLRPRARPSTLSTLLSPECGSSLGEREAASRRALAPPARLPRTRKPPPRARAPAAPHAPPRTTARAAIRILGAEGARAARRGSAGGDAGVQPSSGNACEAATPSPSRRRARAVRPIHRPNPGRRHPPE
jgi:hypothetical protein